jgi:FkbM family methyltransferase
MAQNFEDVMLWRAFSSVQCGFYIDVGAGDPDVESVTRSFYDRGWSGINIEPAEGAWRRLCERRPRDINLQLAVANSIGSQPFFLIDEGGGLSTLRDDVAKVHLANGHLLDEVPCPVVTLARLCEDHVARPIHFLKIDVEGAEREVLEGADLKHFRPWVILVEATYPNSLKQTHAEWEELLSTRGYRFAYFDGLNRFYVAEERWNRIGSTFSQPPNVFDNFVRADEVRAFSRATEMEQVASAAEERAATAEQQATAAQGRVEVAERMAAEAEAKVEIALSALEQARADRDAYEQEVFEVDRHAAWVSQERQNLAWRLDELQRERDRKTQEIDELQHERDRKTQEIDELQHERDRKTQEIDELQHERDRKTQEIDELQRERDRKTQEIGEFQREIECHRKWIQAVYSSTSWKFARPVRAARKLLNLVRARR